MRYRILIIFAIITFLSTIWPVLKRSEGMNESTYPATATIALHKEVTVRNPVVTVGTLADIQSEDKGFKQLLSEVEIERAPLVGYTRILTVNEIKSRLRQHKIDLSQIIFVGHERVAISTKAIEITPEQLLNFARKYLEDNFLAGNERNIIELTMPIRLTVPDGEVSFRIPQESKNIRLSQYTSIPIQIILNGKTYRTLILSLKVKSFKKVVVAAKAIPKDKLLDEDDIRLEERDIIQSPANYNEPLRLTALVLKSDAYGKRAKRRIPQGEILTNKLIEVPPQILRGDKVTILVESPHLKVTTLGMAKEDGYKGKIIRVENISSKKIINAKVVNEKLVRVEL